MQVNTHTHLNACTIAIYNKINCLVAEHRGKTSLIQLVTECDPELFPSTSHPNKPTLFSHLFFWFSKQPFFH
jgi:hypothetical protein